MSKNNNEIEKPSFFKYAILIAIVFFICIISIGLIVVNSDNKKTGIDILGEIQEEKENKKEPVDTDDRKKEEELPEESNSVDELKESMVNSEESEDLIEEVQREFDNLDVEAEVKQIRLWYYSPTESEEKFVLSKGTDGWDYAREYYFHEGVLYFVFIFNGAEEHRLYFKDGVMIRYIDENKNIYDYGNTSDFDSWENRALSESKQFYE